VAEAVSVQFGKGWTKIGGEKLRHATQKRVYNERGRLLMWTVNLINEKHETVATIMVRDGFPQHARVFKTRGIYGSLSADAQLRLARDIAKRRFEQ